MPSPQAVAALESTVANLVGVPASSVTLTITLASLLLTFEVDYTTRFAADSAVATLATAFATPQATSAQLNNQYGAVNVLTTPAVLRVERLVQAPHAPPPPSSPPANPAEVRVTIITATFLIDASADAFDEARFRILLAKALGVIPSVISLTIGGGRRLAEQRELQSAAPLTVTASVHITAEPSAAITTATTNILNSYASDPQLASAALEVVVTSVSPPESTVTFVTKPPPARPAPEPSPPTQPTDQIDAVSEALMNEQAFPTLMTVVGVSVAVVVVCICCIAAYLWKRREEPLPPPPPGFDEGAPSKKKAKQRGSVWVTFGEVIKGKQDVVEQSVSMKISSGRGNKPTPPLAPPPVDPGAISVTSHNTWEVEVKD